MPNCLNYIALVFSISIFLLSQPNIERPEVNISKQDSIINFNTQFISLFSLGQQKMISSFLWVITLLDADLDRYSKDDYQSWIYLRMRSITALDPYFYHAYIYGGMYLATITDDINGAIDIYNRGLEYFPDDFYLNFHIAFNYYHEIGDYKKASYHFEKIINHPKSPKHLPSLISKIKATGGDLKGSFYLLQKIYLSLKGESPIKKRMFRQLYSIKAEIDLKCLNRLKREQCQKKDLKGNYYKKNNLNEYYAQENWTPLRLKKRPIKNNGI